MKRWLEKRVDVAYTVMRVVLGILFAFHGAQKLFGVLGNFRASAGTQLWFGAIIELVTGVAIAAGVFTRCAALVASGTMAVAYVQFHWRFNFGSGFFPIVNKGELALVYSFVFLYIACRGPGPVSIGRKLGRG